MNYWLWFSLIKNVGSRKKLKLLEIYKTPEKIYSLRAEELLKINGFGPETVKNILESKNESLINFHLKYMQENKIEIISIFEKEYPENLKNIYDPPVCLFIKGNKNILNNQNIAIIGCRDCTEYGIKAAKYFGYNVAMKNINVVSGLARGIDSYSHIGCLQAEIDLHIKCSQTEMNNSQKSDVEFKICNEKNNEYSNENSYGKAIAVVGNGLDTIYPKENIKLAQNIIKSGGAIISEYPCGTKPEKMNFPARNRIISGISSGVIVVEAKEKSGTLLTVDFALEQGRDVFVVPRKY